MKGIGQLLKKRAEDKPKIWDEKSIFYAFYRVMREEYGKKGSNILKPHFLKNKKLFISSGNSVWANEVWINRGELIKKINQELGSKEVTEIKIN